MSCLNILNPIAVIRMPRKVLKTQPITVPQVKAILEELGEEKLDQFQRRPLDYSAKFSKVDPEASDKLIKDLIERFELDEGEAVQIINCMPTSIEQLRIFLAGGRKIVETTKLEAILSALNDARKK